MNKNKRVFLGKNVKEEFTSLGSVPGRGGFSYGNNPMNQLDISRGSGELMGGTKPIDDLEKKKLKKKLKII
jgi:hypothetical protein